LDCASAIDVAQAARVIRRAKRLLDIFDLREGVRIPPVCVEPMTDRYRRGYGEGISRDTVVSKRQDCMKRV